MSWGSFIQSLESFFSSVGQAFLANVQASIPALEQAAINFLTSIADAIINDIESGVIPLPALAAEPGATVDPLVLGKQKRDAAFTAIQAQLVKTPPPAGVTVTNSLVYFTIELSVQKAKQMGNGGNLPGGNSGPVSLKK